LRLFSLGLSDEPSLDLLSKTARVFLDFDRGGVAKDPVQSGRGEKGAPGDVLAALQGPSYAEHPGQGPAQGKKAFCRPSEADLAPTGKKVRTAGGFATGPGIRGAFP